MRVTSTVLNATQKDPQFPAVPKGLLTKLNELFPERHPTLDMSEREIFYRAGQRAVVVLLEIEYERQVRVSQGG
jgi:hypothetical protein